MLGAALPVATYAQSGSGEPFGAASMSTAPSPSSEIDPIFAVERSVMIGRMSSLTLNDTSAPFGTSATPVTEPTSMPATRTGDPLISPATFGNWTLSG